MAALTGKKPKDTYKDLLQVSNSNAGVDGTLRFVSDGEGTDSTLKLSTTSISTTSKVVVGGDTAAGDDAAIGYTSAEGLIITGQGSTSDITVKNDADAAVLTVATGTTNVDIVGDVTAATVNADGDTSAGDDAAMGFTSAEGLILTGQGSTNDVTIKNDADAAVISVPTGTTNVTIAGDLTISGDDLTMGTNTSGAALIADGTNFNPVVISGDATVATNGALTIANDAVTSAKIADDAITSALIADDAVVSAAIADDAVVTASIADDAITSALIADDAVVSAAIADSAVTTALINDDAVTLAKMAGLARGKLIYGDSSGNPAALAIGSNTYVLTSDGTDFSWAASSAGAVTSYTNSTDNRVITSVNSSTINGEANLTFDGSVLAVTGNVTASGTIEPAGDTSASDNAAIGYTSTEGLILTGQGSTNDVTIKNDADADVIEIPTGTTNVTIAGNLTTAAGGIATASLADNSVTLAKMAGLARGKIIYGDSSGDPAALAVGSANYVLTSDGTDVAWAAAAGGGKMLQVVSATSTTQTDTTSTSYTDCTGITAAITPAATGSKVLVLISVNVTATGSDAVGEFKIVRTIGASATDLFVFSQVNHLEHENANHFLQQLDSPSTTSAATYKLQFFRTDQSGTLTVNRNDGSDIARSVITLIEVGA